MGFREVFSKREARAMAAGHPDVYRYGDVSSELRAQVVHIWKRAMEPEFVFYDPHRGAIHIWPQIAEEIAEEHGKLGLGRGGPSGAGHLSDVVKYFFELREPGRTLDVIEISFHHIDTTVRYEVDTRRTLTKQHSSAAIDDLNRRFREHSLGYQFANGQIIKISSQYVHAEAVKPALTLLSGPAFKGAQVEFLAAHKHYREGDNKAAVNEALKAFESTLKIICAARKWPFDKDKDTASTLVKIVLDHGLIPPFLESGIGGLRSVLESLVPTTRNRTSGHGQGEDVKDVPEYLAAYMLHVTASNIVMLVEAHEARRYVQRLTPPDAASSGT